MLLIGIPEFFDGRRVKVTSLFWLCDTLETLVCNVIFLPFIYYAVQLEFPPVKYLFIPLILFLSTIPIVFFRCQPMQMILEPVKL